MVRENEREPRGSRRSEGAKMSRYQRAASVKCSLKKGSMDLSCCLIRTGW